MICSQFGFYRHIRVMKILSNLFISLRWKKECSEGQFYVTVLAALHYVVFQRVIHAKHNIEHSFHGQSWETIYLIVILENILRLKNKSSQITECTEGMKETAFRTSREKSVRVMIKPNNKNSWADYRQNINIVKSVTKRKERIFSHDMSMSHWMQWGQGDYEDY